MCDPLNTLVDVLCKQEPLVKEDLVATPFGGLYRSNLWGFGTPWKVYHSAVALVGLDHREWALQKGIKKFNHDLRARIDEIDNALRIYREQQKLKLQGKEFDREKLRCASEEMGQVSLRMIVLDQCGMKPEILIERFRELALIFQTNVLDGSYRAVIPYHFEMLLQCWGENDDFSWVRKLQREVGELPVSALRHLHQTGDDLNNRLYRFVELVNRAYDEGRLSLRVMHRTLVMVVEAMEGVHPRERGYALGLIEHRLEGLGCKIFSAQDQGRKELVLRNQSYICDGQEYRFANEYRELPERKEFVVRLHAGGDQYMLFSLENCARLCMHQSAVRQYWKERGGLTLLCPESLDPTGSCAVINGNLDPIYKQKFNGESLVEELRKIATRGLMPAGNLDELICVRADGTIAWRIQSDKEQEVVPEDIEAFLFNIDREATHRWMIDSGLGALPAATRKRKELFSQLERKTGQIWWRLEDRSTRPLGVYSSRGATKERVMQALKEAMIPIWFQAEGVISNLSEGLMDKVEADAYVNLEREFPVNQKEGANLIVSKGVALSSPSKRQSGRFNHLN